MKRREFFSTMLATTAAAAAGTLLPGCPAPRGLPGEEHPLQEDLLSTPSEKGSAGYHPHLVLPGAMTSYILRVTNTTAGTCEVSLACPDPLPDGWEVVLGAAHIQALEPGACREVLLKIKPEPGLPRGSAITVSVTAQTDSGTTDRAEVAAEVTDRPKIIFLSIDSLHPDYLKLNRLGTGPGTPGDRLMPNLHRVLEAGTFYPNHEVHIITATDMNHFNFLAGTMTGTGGVPLVGGSLFGFDPQGKPVMRYAPLDLNFYGPDRRRISTLFNAAKNHNPHAWNAFASGKNWVPDMMRAPEQQIDLYLNGEDVPAYLEKMEPATPQGFSLIRRLLRAALFGILPRRGHELGNPADSTEPQDPRQGNLLARFMGCLPNHFPPDRWVMDASLKAIANEDPDVFYILLAAVDDAGHAFGSAFDLEEWDDRGSKDPADHVSRYDPQASRQGILNVVREADRQLGRLLEALEARGTLDSTLLIVESDHSMVTYHHDPLDMRDYLGRNCRFSSEKDYFFGTGGSVGAVYLRREDPDVLQAVEAALETWRVKNPLSGEAECPVYVFNREEMRSGRNPRDPEVSMLPREYYSEYFIEHRQPGEQMWPHLLVLGKPHYEFKVQNFGLGNLGLRKTRLRLPERGWMTGGHGSFETRSALLVLRGPRIPRGVAREEKVYCSDVAPSLYRLMGWPVPDSVDGKPLPGIGVDETTA